MPPTTTTSIQGTRGRSAAAAHEEGQSDTADTAMVAPLASPRSETTSRSLPKARLCVHRDAEQLAELPHHEHQRHAADVAQQHRA